MKNSKITRKLTHGMYVLTTTGGGCVVDAVMQVSRGDQPLIAVAVMKENHTHKLMQENQKFGISILSQTADPEIIKKFGFNCSKDIDKFADINTETVENVKVIKNSIGYMMLEKVDSIDCNTHTLFIGKMVEGDVLHPDETPMTYAYYQENKEDLLKITTEKGKTAWICTVCGYVYYGDEVPDDFICPICKLGKQYFKKKEN